MQRLESLLESDVQYVSQQMLELLQYEIQKTVSNFVNLASGVKVRFIKQDGKIKFTAEFLSDRVRALGFIPKAY